MDVQLGVPDDVKAAIAQQIVQRGGAAGPTFDALPENPGGVATILIPGQARQQLLSAGVANFGSDVVDLMLELSKEQLDSLVAAFTTKGGGYEIEYTLSVPARLPAVDATLHFDSTIAFQYQVTQPSYNDWGDETSPGSVQKLLNESAASSVVLNWGTPPSDELRQTVATWANLTLASQVKAEVEETIRMQGLSSGESFSISEVSSFTSEYHSNEVIDWILVPTRTLPSFTDLGLDIAQFTTTVNEQQQVMQVCVDVPFTGQSSNGADGAAVEAVTVTVSYPGLSEADGTATFHQSGTATFTAPYDLGQGRTWSLEYTATYAGSQVTGWIEDIEQGLYTLALPQVGILRVKFDARNAFASGVEPMPKALDIMATYPDFDGQGAPYQRTFTLTSAQPTYLLESTSPMPLTRGIDFQVLYQYPGSTTFLAPTQADQTAALQVIPAAAALREVGLLILIPADTSPGVIEADVQVYYAGELQAIPGASAGHMPISGSPARFTLTPQSDSRGIAIGKATFIGVVNSDQPLVYSASITTDDGNQVDIDEQLLDSTIATVLVSPTERYFTLQVVPTAIDWEKAEFTSVQVLVDATIGTKVQPQQTVTWTKDAKAAGNTDTSTRYLTWPTQEGQDVSYEWHAEYVITGSGTKVTTPVSAKDTILDVPANPPADAAVATFVTGAVVFAASAI